MSSSSSFPLKSSTTQKSKTTSKVNPNSIDSATATTTTIMMRGRGSHDRRSLASRDLNVRSSSSSSSSTTVSVMKDHTVSKRHAVGRLQQQQQPPRSKVTSFLDAIERREKVSMNVTSSSSSCINNNKNSSDCGDDEDDDGYYNCMCGNDYCSPPTIEEETKEEEDFFSQEENQQTVNYDFDEDGDDDDDSDYTISNDRNTDDDSDYKNDASHNYHHDPDETESEDEDDEKNKLFLKRISMRKINIISRETPRKDDATTTTTAATKEPSTQNKKSSFSSTTSVSVPKPSKESHRRPTSTNSTSRSRTTNSTSRSRTTTTTNDLSSSSTDDHRRRFDLVDTDEEEDDESDDNEYEHSDEYDDENESYEIDNHDRSYNSSDCQSSRTSKGIDRLKPKDTYHPKRQTSTQSQKDQMSSLIRRAATIDLLDTDNDSDSSQDDFLLNISRLQTSDDSHDDDDDDSLNSSSSSSSSSSSVEVIATKSIPKTPTEKRVRRPNLQSATMMKIREGNRDSVTRSAFREFNTKAFDGKLSSVEVVWSKKLNTTAGQTRLLRGASTSLHTPRPRLAVVELSTKVVDDISKLRTTLLHELVHAAVWILEGVSKPPHGKDFKRWANIAMRRIPDIVVTTTHKYEISYRYAWACTDPNCSFLVKRHSKSVDIKKHVCGRCKSNLVEVDSTASNGIVATPKKQAKPSAYNMFVKEQSKRIRQDLLQEQLDLGIANPAVAQSDVMKECAKRWREQKQKQQIKS